MKSAGGSPGAAAALASAWAVALVLLAVGWIQSPFSGSGPMFGAWSALALPLAAWTASRRGAWGLEALPGGWGVRGTAMVVWALAAGAATSGLPAEWTIDGLILRDDTLRAAGTFLGWFPGLFGLILSVAGLAWALEARHRLAARES